jgi:hypothetical protein
MSIEVKHIHLHDADLCPEPEVEITIVAKLEKGQDRMHDYERAVALASVMHEVGKKFPYLLEDDDDG